MLRIICTGVGFNFVCLLTSILVYSILYIEVRGWAPSRHTKGDYMKSAVASQPTALVLRIIKLEGKSELLAERISRLARRGDEWAEMKIAELEQRQSEIEWAIRTLNFHLRSITE